ncbi:zinc-dependent alcohol dehydrogenase family protein [Vibrio penaeicida]|uniref:zinc-dependent alcohol dehydrogenase family protein n=1 Tax=Vibrio penaeicida TaxID=104609 RepID=UPI002736F6A6|nr:zinc-dependent alcohol dehydrogenase family protein [Vibrio penaeicida]MDP2574562.1 zinc-dependent alcohol dehydrogenase family protein [Vibrio penaeicida]
MKAYIVDEYCNTAVFKETTVSEPEIKPGHVLIKVKATSLNPVDNKMLRADLGINTPTPAVMHMDVSGIVVEVGRGVTKFREGDKVYGCAGGLMGPEGPIQGALADLMVADADLLAHMPVTASFVQAAALPLVTITAWECIYDKANIQKGEHILIHAGTGGVGHMAVQLAKRRGALVSTTISDNNKASIATRLGADNIINYKSEEVEKYVARLTDGKGFDVVFDTVGDDNIDRSLEAVKMWGEVVAVNPRMQNLQLMHAKSLTLHFVLMLLPLLTGNRRAHHGQLLSEISRYFDQGELKPLIHDVFPFNKVNEAHKLFEQNTHIGKIVLENV